MCKYALFLGCTVPVRGLNYEQSVREVAKKLGIEFQDISEFTCCGFPVKSVDIETAMVMAARNLAVAEKEGYNICTLCSACTSVLTETNKELKENRRLRDRINKKLGDIAYNGTIEVKHFSRILYEDVGLKQIGSLIKKKLKGLKIAAHYGCHYLKPSEIYDRFDDPEVPESMDKLIELTGAESIKYCNKNNCCGGGILGIKEEIALKMAKKKLDSIKSENADAIVSICPFCTIMYEGNQKKIEKTFETTYGIPVIYYPQLLGVAFGIPSENLGFKLNKIKSEKISSYL